MPIEAGEQRIRIESGHRFRSCVVPHVAPEGGFDVPEYWEWSGEGLYPFDASNEAYELGVNYVVYGLTR